MRDFKVIYLIICVASRCYSRPQYLGYDQISIFKEAIIIEGRPVGWTLL